VTRRFFLISPANIAGIRGRRLIAENANSELAKRLRAGGVPLGELYTFISSLYFRGKLAYASAFGSVDASFVITGCGGLVPPSTNVSLEELQKLAAVDFDPTDPRYRDPLDRDLRRLLEMAPNCEIVLLGSIATPKYVDPVLEVFGERLLFPEEFIGRGDMSRGGLMLRSVESGVELTYLPLCKAKRHGRKPPKLAPLPRNKIRDGRTE
jgi:hypothetical protein